MKRLSKIIGKLFKIIGSFFDKWLITPITKIILKIVDIFDNKELNLGKFLSRKSSLIAISLFLAFITFVFIERQSNVMIDQYAEILYNQPVEAIYNEELYVVEGLPKTVDITLIGQKRHIFLAKQSPSKAVSVDLTGLKPGNHRVTLKYSQKLKSLDYKVDPSQVTVTIYEKVSETRGLTYDILHQDSLDSKSYINNVELDRDSVIIKGAAYKLEKVATVKALVDVKDFTNPKAGEMNLKNIPLVAYDTNGKVVEVEIVPKTVSATITITSPSKTVPIRVVPTGDLAFGKSISSIETNISSITVYGSEAAIDKINTLEVEIDVKGLSTNKEFNVTLKKPSGIKELSVKTINIKVKVDHSTSKEFTGISISTENLDSKYSVQALSKEDQEVTVVVQGSESILKDFDASTLKAYIDLKGYGVGEHEVEVKVTGDDVRLTYSSKTKKVKVRITAK